MYKLLTFISKWSFGIVLWELITRGNIPYADVDTWEILRYLKVGNRMAQPSDCPNAL